MMDFLGEDLFNVDSGVVESFREALFMIDLV